MWSSGTLHVHSENSFRELHILAPYMYILTTYLESSTIWRPSCSSGTLYVHSRTLHIAMTPSMYILEPNLPDSIINVCSLSGMQISWNYFTYRSVIFCESCVEDQILQDLIRSTRLCGANCIALHGWVVNFRLTKMVRRKWFVPVRYQRPKGKSVGLALKSFTWFRARGKRRGFSSGAAARHSK